MSRSSSNLRVFVHFKEDSVFAGEDVECTITFKNVALTREHARRPFSGQSLNGGSRASGGGDLEQSKSTRSPLRPEVGRTIPVTTQGTARTVSGIFTEESLASPMSNVGTEPYHQSPISSGKGFPVIDSTREKKHGRSVSIISIGSSKDEGSPMRSTKTESVTQLPPRHAKRFSQSSVKGVYGSESIARPSGTLRDQDTPSHQSGTSTPLLTQDQRFEPVSPNNSSRRASVVSPYEVRHASPILEKQANRLDNGMSAKAQPSQQRAGDMVSALQLQKVRSNGSAQDLTAPEVEGVRKFSVLSNDETPRPSIDIYNMSNRSDETLVSELPFQSDSRLLRGQYGREPSFLTLKPPTEQKIETLMMGYVQVSGNFVLDGSLVNRAPFEEVKRRAVVGGQAGGGVVGIARNSADSGLFGALSWSNIGESLGGLLGTGQPSSMREMKDIAGTESIPLLATPKSILFVDLKLSPGQSKSFSYKFKMPRGLPPSHRGRAMKVSYNIVIGTHRPSTARTTGQQQIKQVSIPFRLFGGVNAQGESLGHDLMSPYILLKEKATILSLDPSTPLPTTSPATSPSRAAAEAADFQSYVSHLLNDSRSDTGLLSPSADLHVPQTPRTPMTPRPLSRTGSRSFSPPPTAPSTRTLIDHAIRWSGLRHSAIYSPTTFNIARASTPIATLKISRSALRLGDLLVCVVDFAGAQMPTYAIEASLESSERVDPSLAIRSQASVERVTRRVWARTSECTVAAKRMSWGFQVPVAGTPSFATTGVGLEWCVRVEIVVGVNKRAEMQQEQQQLAEEGDDDDAQSEPNEHEHLQRKTSQQAPTPNGNGHNSHSQTIYPTPLPLSSTANILEVVDADERGALLAPKVRLHCESFEVAIPLRVFGAAVGVDWGGGGDGAGGAAGVEDGLAV